MSTTTTNSSNNLNHNQPISNSISVYQHNVQGFAHSLDALINNHLQQQPHISLLQEAYRSTDLDPQEIKSQIKPQLGNIYDIQMSEIV